MRNFLPAILWLIVITFLSLLPGNSIPEFSWTEIAGFDKLAHIVVYLVLIFLVAFGYQKKDKSLSIKWVFVFAGYGILLELLQNMMYMGRRFEFLDIIANIIGLILGYFMTQRFYKNK